MSTMELDVLILGGGAAGLWLLDRLSRRGDRVLLLEGGRLGQGQTIAAQGIIHGGLKYTLQGLLTPAASGIRDMPELWRRSLSGAQAPDLRQTRLRASGCLLWRTDSLRSRLGLWGARVGLRAVPREVAAADRPDCFKGCPGTLAMVDEPVIAPESFLADLARQHHNRILRVDAARGLSAVLSGAGVVERVVVTHPVSGRVCELRPKRVVLTAGAGNAALRRMVGLAADAMQKRPLHMALVRGDLPIVNGHCIDGARTRVTVTSDRDSAGRTVWQLGGQIAEAGVALDSRSLVRHARAELEAVLPGVDFAACEWSTYRVDRAERATGQGGRHDLAAIVCEGNVVTGWPTKLALAPQLARAVEAVLPDPSGKPLDPEPFCDWPRPEVAPLPWEVSANWMSLERFSSRREAA